MGRGSPAAWYVMQRLTLNDKLETWGVGIHQKNPCSDKFIFEICVNQSFVRKMYVNSYIEKF
jgi:hypothetical protein